MSKETKETKALTHIEGIINQTTQSRMEAAWSKIVTGLPETLCALCPGDLLKIPSHVWDRQWHYGFSCADYTGKSITMVGGSYVKMSTAVIMSYLRIGYWANNESKVRDQVIKEITERLAILPTQ